MNSNKDDVQISDEEKFNKFIEEIQYDNQIDRFYQYLEYVPGMTKEKVKELQKRHLEATPDEALGRLGRFGYTHYEPESSPSCVFKVPFTPKTTFVCIKYSEPNSYLTLTDIFGENRFATGKSFDVDKELELISVEGWDSDDVFVFGGDNLQPIAGFKLKNSNEFVRATNKIAYILQNLDKFEGKSLDEAVKILSFAMNSIKNSKNQKFALYNFKTQKAEEIEFKNEQEKLAYLEVLSSQIKDVLEKRNSKNLI